MGERSACAEVGVRTPSVLVGISVVALVMVSTCRPPWRLGLKKFVISGCDGDGLRRDFLILGFEGVTGMLAASLSCFRSIAGETDGVGIGDNTSIRLISSCRRGEYVSNQTYRAQSTHNTTGD